MKGHTGGPSADESATKLVAASNVDKPDPRRFLTVLDYDGEFEVGVARRGERKVEFVVDDVGYLRSVGSPDYDRAYFTRDGGWSLLKPTKLVGVYPEDERDD